MPSPSWAPAARACAPAHRLDPGGLRTARPDLPRAERLALRGRLGAFSHGGRRGLAVDGLAPACLPRPGMSLPPVRPSPSPQPSLSSLRRFGRRRGAPGRRAGPRSPAARSPRRRGVAGMDAGHTHAAVTVASRCCGDCPRPHGRSRPRRPRAWRPRGPWPRRRWRRAPPARPRRSSRCRRPPRPDSAGTPAGPERQPSTAAFRPTAGATGSAIASAGALAAHRRLEVAHTRRTARRAGGSTCGASALPVSVASCSRTCAHGVSRAVRQPISPSRAWKTSALTFSRRHAEDLRDLLVGMVADLEQDQRSALIRRQALDVADEQPQVGAAVDLRRQPLGGGGAVLERGLLAPRAHDRQAAVARDRVEPRLERRSTSSPRTQVSDRRRGTCAARRPRPPRASRACAGRT